MDEATRAVGNLTTEKVTAENAGADDASADSVTTDNAGTGKVGPENASADSTGADKAGAANVTAAKLTRERWEANADYWVKIIRERRDRYRTELTDKAVLDAIGPCEGLRILDAGCGEGYLARRLAAMGADVVGIDAAQGLIDAARSAPATPDGAGGAAGSGDPAAGDPVSGGTVSFARASVDAMPVEDDGFDLVVCNHLFSHLRDPSDAIREFGRVLKSGGRLVILTLHPCFYTFDAERGATDAVPAARYFAPRGIDQRFMVDGLESPAEITSWLRPLEFYSGTLRDAGFVIADLREPHPSAEQLRDDPWWREGFPIALFMLLIAERR
ncbi:class I SAM-dependent methyltransferase [Actinomadura sp. 9N407]|uniref:class I SAM-dependent methyltransferase n=1 Tax=Actinomadura sp. 9N407 TaxID=3375154 RepID=UPI0037A9E9B0